ATLDRGEVTWPGDSLFFEHADWNRGNLAVHAFKWREYSSDVRVEVAKNNQLAATIDIPANQTHVSLTWAGADATLTGTFRDQPLRVQARFPSKGWLPETAEVVATDWKLPAAELKLGTQYDQVAASAHLVWQVDHFEVNATAKAAPKSQASAPPIALDVAARGDRQKLTVTKLLLNAPFATATLSAPVELSFGAKLPTGLARLKLEADLSKQPWIDRATGTLHANVEVNRDSRLDFSADLQDLQVGEIAIRHASGSGSLAWPRLALRQLKLELDAGSNASASGAVDLAAHELHDVTFKADGLTPVWFSRWLPRTVTWLRADVSGQVSGPWLAPQHRGTLQLKQARAASSVTPFDLQVDWTGSGVAVQEFNLKAAVPNSNLEISGAVDATRVQLRKFRFVPGTGGTWDLAAPATLSWSPAWSVENFQWRTQDAHLSAALSGEHNNPALTVHAANIPSSLLKDWIDLRGPDWQVNNLRASAHRAGDVVAFDAQLSGRIALSPAPAEISASLRGDENGVKIESVKLLDGARPVAEAGGTVPVSWRLGNDVPWQIAPDKPFEFHAHVEPDASTWSHLAEASGIALDTPSAEIRLGGTLNQPTGELRASAKRLALPRSQLKDSLPEITDLSLAAHADRGQLTIETLEANIEGHPVNANGRLPLAGDGWRELFRDPAGYAWRTGEGHLAFAEMELRSLARRFPTLLSPQGRMTARVDLHKQGQLSGQLFLLDAATRPISTLGALKEINAELALAGRSLTIRSWSARLGGEPVVLTGTIDLPETSQPRLALKLKGENLPLVRRSGVLVRTDLDLHADTDKNNVTQVTGVANLRQCVVLADLAAMVPTGKRTAAQQPPYFSVPTAPFNHWPLSVDVRGRKAIRIKTAVYQGTSSANFHLGGTLGEPWAVGEVTADDGRVLFPFATFTVQSAAVRLSEADPYHPQLMMHAAAQYHDYQLRLEGSGPIETPNLTFTSIPALETTEVLLMVTSGQMPEKDTTSSNTASRMAGLGAYLGQGLLQGSSGDASRIEVSAGQKVSRQGRETYEFSYRLDDRWSLVGEYDEYDEYNAGIKWRAYTQEGDATKKTK
ncbi:MAG TPA: translocation/assembly module TamB domain-containing protein, partial [Candidatus Didemnitutus sp.]|nr:translocation/assembly module TamB domain-containing protein [Candidatus Didemnitutus sp.]